METLTLGYPYYRQPEILALQYDVWSRYPFEFEIIICDDGSPDNEAKDVPIPEKLKGRVKIFKIKKDRPWNWHAARNICIKETITKWLLITDLDHIVSGQVIREITEGKLDPKRAHNFTRYDYDTMKPTLHPRTGEPKFHPNTWAMTTKNFQKLYVDERWQGQYGGDGSYGSRVKRTLGSVVLSPFFVYRVPRAACRDASGGGATLKEARPKNWRDKFKRKLEADGGLHAYVHLSQAYERIL